MVEIPSKKRKINEPLESKIKKVIEIANAYLEIAVVGKKVETTEAEVTLNEWNEFETASVRCPLCVDKNFLKLAVAKNRSPRQVFIGNFKKHVEGLHQEGSSHLKPNKSQRKKPFKCSPNPIEERAGPSGMSSNILPILEEIETNPGSSGKISQSSEDLEAIFDEFIEEEPYEHFTSDDEISSPKN